MSDYDFIIIGAGIAGASAGYELARLGRTLLLERESQPGYHTTGRSAAQFVETYGGETIRRLTKASRAFLESPPDGFTEHPILSLRVVLFISRPDQMRTLERTHAVVRALAPEVRTIEPDEAIELVPVLRPDYLAGAMVEPDAMDMDVHALHQGYLRGTARRAASALAGARSPQLV